MEKQSYRSSLLLITFVLSLSIPCLSRVWQTCTGSQHLVVCVTNDAEEICDQPSNGTTSIAGVSRVLARYHGRCVSLYFTGGLHVLENDLNLESNDISVEISVQMVGGIDPQTIIKSRSLSVRSVRGKLLILNIFFLNCSGWMVFNVHHLNLENVTIQNADNKMHVYLCPQTIIRNCKFLNNTNGHIMVDSNSDSYLGPTDMHLYIAISITVLSWK